MKMTRTKKKISLTFSCLQILVSCTLLFSHPAYAQQPSQADVHKKNEKISKEAAEKSTNTAIANFVAAAVCASNCAAEAVGFGLVANVCAITSLGVLAYELYENQTLSASIVGTGVAVYGALTAASTGVAGSILTDNLNSSCVAAGIHALFGAYKLGDAREQKEKAKEAGELAKKASNNGGDNTTTNPTNPNTDVDGFPLNTANANNNGGGLTTLGVTDAGADDATTLAAQDCTSQREEGDVDGFFSCLSADGQSIPGLSDNFRNATGLDLGEFLASIPNNASAGEILGASLSKTGNPQLAAAGKRLDALTADPEFMAELKSNFGGEGGTVLASSGGGAGSSSDDGSDKKKSVSLASLFPAEKKKAALESLSKFGSSKGKLDADAIMADRNRDIFARVSEAYQSALSANKLEKRSWASEFNQALHGLNTVKASNGKRQRSNASSNSRR